MSSGRYKRMTNSSRKMGIRNSRGDFSKITPGSSPVCTGKQARVVTYCRHPSPIQTVLSALESHQILHSVATYKLGRLAGLTRYKSMITAGREFHPAPKECVVV